MAGLLEIGQDRKLTRRKAMRDAVLKGVILIALAAIMMAGCATVPATTYATDLLRAGEELRRGDYLTSLNGQYRLILQRDGNLVLYGPREQTIWSSGTQGMPIEKCIMQGDGNLVLYLSNGQPAWSSNTPRYPGAFLAVQSDGNLVIYLPQPVWATNTVQPQWQEHRDRRREPHRREDR